MQYRFITFENFTLPYLTIGTGPHLLIAFHGYQMQASDFNVFASTLGTRYTIIAFDLFYHGTHAVRLEQALPPADSFAIARIIEQLLWETRYVRFSLMGFSLGGRLAMSIAQIMPHRVKELFLLAPDGLKRPLHEEFVTQTIAGDLLFRYLIGHPAPFFSVCSTLLKLRLMNEKQYRFIISNMESREQRLHVYRTWNTFKKLKPDLKLIAHHVNKRKIKVLIFMGKEDKIIRPVLAKRLSGRLNSRDVVRLLDCGHHLLQKSDEIAAIILQSE